MSKITKRILSIILVLVLAVSGVLSGIPGGGVVRGEEWDIEMEITGEETVGSAFVEEESEENEEEKLTNASLKDTTKDNISSVSADNDKDNETSVLGSNKEEIFNPSASANSIFVSGESEFKDIDDETYSEDAELEESTRLAGDGEPNYIYYTNWNANGAWTGGWEGHDGEMYAWVWQTGAAGDWVPLYAIGKYTKDNITGLLFRGAINDSNVNNIKVVENNNWDTPGKQTQDHSLIIGSLYSLTNDPDNGHSVLDEHAINPNDPTAWDPARDIIAPASTTVYFTNKDWGGAWVGNFGEIYAYVLGGMTYSVPGEC